MVGKVFGIWTVVAAAGHDWDGEPLWHCHNEHDNHKFIRECDLGKADGRCRMVEYNGETRSVKDWCDRLGLNYGVVMGRLQMGWSAEDTFNKPVRARRCV